MLFLPLPSESAPASPAPSTALLLTRQTAFSLGTLTLVLVFVLFATVGQVVQWLNPPFGLILSSLFVFGSAGLVFALASGTDAARFLGLSRVPWGLVALGALLGAVNLPFASFLMGAASEVLPESWSAPARATERMLLDAAPMTRLVLATAAGFAAPLGEEIFFRGWLQTLLAQPGVLSERRRNWLSALVVGVVFSLIHVDPVGFVARTELGLLFGLLRAWSGSLWPAIAMHASHNLLSTLALYATEQAPEAPAEFVWRDASLLAGGALVFTLALLETTRRLGQSVASTYPDMESPGPLRWLPQRASGVVFLSAGVLIAGAVVFSWMGPSLPGAELRPGAPIERHLPLEAPQPSDPQDGSGHLE